MSTEAMIASSESVKESASLHPSPVSIDIGSGSHAKSGYLGIGRVACPGVDYVVDIEREPLPFPDSSVQNVYSTHCFSHLRNSRFILSEIGRVCRDGARIEIWTPYAHHNNALLDGHVAYFTEEWWHHLTLLYPAAWRASLGGTWLWRSIRYVVTQPVIDELHANRIDIDFAIRHMNNIVKEFCVEFEYRSAELPPSAPKRWYSNDRDTQQFPLADVRPIVGDMVTRTAPVAEQPSAAEPAPSPVKAPPTASPEAPLTRRGLIERFINVRQASLLEIGALNNPTYLKNEANISYLDWCSPEESAQFRESPGAIVPDYVTLDKHFAKVVTRRFDAVIANHVVEHIPDLIGWFQNVSAVLENGGRLFLSVPHKYYIFDRRRHPTRLADLLRAYREDYRRPDFYQVLEHLYETRPILQGDVWNQVDISKALETKRFTLRKAMELAEREVSKPYSDCHCHVFTTDSFVDIVGDLFTEGFIDLKIVEVHEPQFGGNEFRVVMTRVDA